MGATLQFDKTQKFYEAFIHLWVKSLENYLLWSHILFTKNLFLSDHYTITEYH